MTEPTYSRDPAVNNSPEVFVLKGDTPQAEHVHGAGCGCGHQGQAGPPGPEKPKPVGFLRRMQTRQLSELGKRALASPGTGPSGEPEPTRKPKKKKRDWSAEIRKLRQDGD